MDVEVVIETPQGSRNKYKADPKSGRIRLDRMLFTSTVSRWTTVRSPAPSRRTAIPLTCWSGWTSRHFPVAW